MAVTKLVDPANAEGTDSWNRLDVYTKSIRGQQTDAQTQADYAKDPLATVEFIVCAVEA